MGRFGRSNTQEATDGTTSAFSEGLLSGNKPAFDAEADKADRRSVVLNQPTKNDHYVRNQVTTAKYSLIPLSLKFILWKNLWEQFQKAANVYFLVISILQVIPGLSPTGRYATLLPLCLVLLLTLLKDSWEDWKRRVQDRAVNNRIAKVFRNTQWILVPWREIMVGDIVMCEKGDPFPADLVLLWTSQEDGLCYIETSSLDGETNLKLRRSVEVSSTILKTIPPAITQMDIAGTNRVPNPKTVNGRIVCELPNNRLYNFDGYLELVEGVKMSPRAALSADNILLRGSELRNTSYVLAVAHYTGDDSKLMHNMTSKHHKTSKVDSLTNRQIFYVFLLQIVLAIACAIGYSISRHLTEDHWYLGTFTDSASESGALAFITFTILYNALIPISLYIMMEMVKVIQATLINSDVHMFHEDSNTPAMVRNSQLNEELGQVEYIFSDKTGTLTCNMMEFKKFCCLGKKNRSDGGGGDGYDGNQQGGGQDTNQIDVNLISYGDVHTEPSSSRSHISAASSKKAGSSAANEFVDRRVTLGRWQQQENKEELRAFFEAMAVCHTVIPEFTGGGRVNYQASSPDESCLVKAAASLGFSVVHRTDSQVVVELADKSRKTYEVLTTIEFTSARKRMSIVVRDPHGRLSLITKGADNVLLGMLRVDPDTNSAMNQCRQLLSQYAGDGLRTLVYAKVDLTEDVYRRWRKRFDIANTDIHDRQEKVDAVALELEKEMDLVGVTGIEDKLQDGVPQAIELLTKAGTKLWVLTGDKQETAINIGYACNLLNSTMGLFTFDNCNRSNIRHALEKYILDVEAASVEAGQDIGLIIQGNVLEHILPTKTDPNANEDEADLFVSLAIRCKAVICCRVSPIQKAKLVEAVKDRVSGVTLAIGDGANDVSMIQMAHVGVGISGLEGLQAARASDYSIAQFRFLLRLLLVHGRWNYNRISKLIVFSFYKNMSLYMTQFVYSFFNLFTGQSLYDSWSLAMYNLAFTALPIMAIAVFDKDVEAKRLLSVDQFPELYEDGMRNRRFNTLQFWKYTGTALLHSLICFLLPAYAASEMAEKDSGRMLGMPGHAITAYTAILLVVTIKSGFETNTWTVANWTVCFASLFFWPGFLFFYCSFYRYAPLAPDFAFWYGADTITLGQPLCWLTAIVVTVFALLRDFAYKFYRKHFDHDLVSVIQAYHSFDVPFNRYDIKKSLPWLFPKQELKEFKPSLAEGLGRHRFGGGGDPDESPNNMSIAGSGGVGGGDSSPSRQNSSFVVASGVGGSSLSPNRSTFSFLAAVIDQHHSAMDNDIDVAAASPTNRQSSPSPNNNKSLPPVSQSSRRRIRISDIVDDEDEYEMDSRTIRDQMIFQQQQRQSNSPQQSPLLRSQQSTSFLPTTTTGTGNYGGGGGDSSPISPASSSYRTNTNNHQPTPTPSHPYSPSSPPNDRNTISGVATNSRGVSNSKGGGASGGGGRGTSGGSKKQQQVYAPQANDFEGYDFYEGEDAPPPPPEQEDH